jgi:hypothetical protein
MSTLQVRIRKDIYPPVGMKFGLLRHPDWIDFGEPGLDKQLPSAVPMQDLPVSSPVYKGRTIPALPPVWHHIKDTNDADGRAYAASVGSLLINIPYSAGQTPKFECVMSGGNYVGYFPVSSTTSHIKLIAYAHDADLSKLNPYVNNFFNMPWLYWECSSYDADGHSGHVWGNVHSFIPRIQYGNTGLWMLKSKVWFFPDGYERIHFKNGVEVWNGNTPLVTFKNGQRIIHDPRWAGMPQNVIALTEDRSHFLSD